MSSQYRERLLPDENYQTNYGTAYNNDNDEEEPLFAKQQIQKEGVNIKVYKRRWYILLVYGLMAMTQCAVWNTFSPISQAATDVFGWNTAGFSLLTNWGPIAYVIGTFAFSWIIDEKGLRPACVLSGFLVVVGTGMRCISTKTSIATP